MKKYIGLLLMLFSLEATAQLHMKANLQTNHLWRGIEVADGLVITGDVNYSLCNGLFNLGFWGGTNTQGTYKEFNYHISFLFKGFSLALWDTFYFSTNQRLPAYDFGIHVLFFFVYRNFQKYFCTFPFHF